MTNLPTEPIVHATAVLVGARAVLIRGPSGAGKSRLALDLLEAVGSGPVRFARLVGDDRVHVAAVHGRLLVRPVAPLLGLIEVRGLGILQLPYEPVARVGLVVDLDAVDAERMPAKASRMSEIEGIKLPRLPVAAQWVASPLVLAVLRAHTQIW